MWFLVTWAWCNNSTSEELCNFLVVYFMLMLSLYFLTLLYSTVSGLEQSFDHFFCSNT